MSSRKLGFSEDGTVPGKFEFHCDGGVADGIVLKITKGE
jgi:hypothetical protein